MKQRVLSQARVGTVLSARRRACDECRSSQVHSLVRSGVRRWLRWGPPAYCLEQFAMCNACRTRQPLDGWFDEPVVPVTAGLVTVPPTSLTEYPTAELALQQA